MNEREWLQKIGNDMGISKALWEIGFQYETRILLSFASLWMLTALHNRNDEESKNDWVSVVSVRRSTKQRFDTLLSLYPEYKNIDTQEVIDYIWDTHLKNGNMYHKENYVIPTGHCLIGDDGASIIRGMTLEEPVSMSGLSPYVRQRAENDDIADAFDLVTVPPSEIPSILWRRSILQQAIIESNMEYLNIHRSARESYYTPKKPSIESMILARAQRDDNSYDYYLMQNHEMCRINDNAIQMKWHHYAQLAIMNQKTPQKILYTTSSALIRIEPQYRLPEPEARFLRLVSWPDDFSGLKSQWHFNLSPALWPIVQRRLTFLGYKLEVKQC